MCKWQVLSKYKESLFYYPHFSSLALFLTSDETSFSSLIPHSPPSKHKHTIPFETWLSDGNKSQVWKKTEPAELTGEIRRI